MSRACNRVWMLKVMHAFSHVHHQLLFAIQTNWVYSHCIYANRRTSKCLPRMLIEIHAHIYNSCILELQHFSIQISSICLFSLHFTYFPYIKTKKNTKKCALERKSHSKRLKVIKSADSFSYAISNWMNKRMKSLRTLFPFIGFNFIQIADQNSTTSSSYSHSYCNICIAIGLAGTYWWHIECQSVTIHYHKTTTTTSGVRHRTSSSWKAIETEWYVAIDCLLGCIFNTFWCSNMDDICFR